MTFVDVLLNVLSIIGIVAIGGVVIYFLGGLLLSILEAKNKKEQVEDQAQPMMSNEKEFVEEQKYEDTLVDEKFSLEEEAQPVDFDKATEEKKSLETQPQPQENLDNLFDDEKEFNFDDFDFDAFFNEQNQTEDLKVAEEPVKEETPVAEPAPVEESPVLEPAPVEPAVEETAPVALETKSYAEENFAEIQEVQTVAAFDHAVEDELRKEVEALKAELAEQKMLYEALKAQYESNEKKWDEEKTNLENLYADAEKRSSEAQNKTQTALSIEEYEARLVVLRERLKANESDLKQNRKEFLPLKRVRKNLDKDKSKLRRREALVAKQKVLLYGVNNIMEIDQEKAKKLAEDLDLLDGLKVSVRHCEEVMEANKERYPILETANRILVTTNEELKADILACEKAIKKLKGEDVEDDVLTIEPAQPVAKRKRGRPRKVQTQENAQMDMDQIVGLSKEQTIVHTAQTENVNMIAESKEVLDNILEQPIQETMIKVERLPETNEKQKTIQIKKEETITQTITEPLSQEENFDDYEPSFEELFAVENEMYDLIDDDLFDNFDDKK